MYEWIPPKNNKKAQKTTLLLFCGAALLMAFPILFSQFPYRWIPQLISLGLLTAAIFMMTRYIAKFYIYRILDLGNGTLDLTVTEAKAGGKGQITVCRIGISGIRECVLGDDTSTSDGKRLLAQKRKEHKKIFDYCADFHPEQSIVLVVEEGGEELVLRLSYDPALFEVLDFHRPNTVSKEENDGWI